MFTILLLCLAASAAPANAQRGASFADDTRAVTLLLQSQTVSARHVVFVYAGDLWIVERSGGVARHLTTDAGLETNPRLSPDGQWVAYSGQYDGNTDVYVLPTTGGTPKRLTWHPGRDTVRDWHPDGERVLFSSSRASGPGISRLFVVNRAQTTPEPLAIPRATHAAYSADARHVVYTPISDAFGSWKRYRGGRVNKVWIYDTTNHDVEEVPHVNASDTYPVFAGKSVYFASDRDGHMNLFRYQPKSKQSLTQITRFTDYDIRSVSAGGGAIAFEQAGAIHLLDPTDDSVKRLRIQVVSDGLASRPRWQTVKGHVRSGRISPNGKRALFEARGEILTVPREHGDPRNITRSAGEHDRSPIWSPDGERIAWLSDRDGEYRLWVRDRLGQQPAKSFDLQGGGFYYDPQWSPDGEHVLFRDKSNRLAFVTLATGAVTQVARAEGSLGVVRTSAAWSPNSEWIAFEKRNARTLYDRIALYRLSDGSTTVLTDGFGDAGSPAFSRDGKFLFFTASVESGPTQFGLDMESSATREPANNMYLVVLQRTEPHPFAARSDDATGDDDEEDDGKGWRGKRGRDGKDGSDDEDEPIADIDVDGIDQRIVAIPLPSDQYNDLACSKDKLLFIVRGDDGATLTSYDLKEREKKTVATKVQGYDVSGDGRAALVRSDGSWKILRLRGGESKSYSVAIDSAKVRVDPAVEWPQILREAWRIERDYFYDAGMHGVDWDAMWQRWSPFVAHVRHRADLNIVLKEMIGELACGHNYVSGGETPDSEEGVPTGVLGADFTEDGGRFRFARVYRGQNWNPTMRAPLTEPGVDVREGDYLIAVNGQPVTTDTNLFASFVNTADQQISLTVSANSGGNDARTSTVVPLRSDRSLRQLSWVEDNRARVDKLSNGRLAYIYMPNTGRQGMASFDRDYYSQLDKQGLIIDERFNGGGQVADYVIHVLSRKVLSYWMNREQWAGRSPFAMIPGPKVMVINERAGSGGDWMPWAFQRMGIGKLVGTRTWGGLVGISGYPPLMDGGRVTAASFGVMDTNGDWAVENVGVPPDHEVIQWPKLVIAGRDPQLEKAVAVALAELESTEPEKLPKFKPPVKR